jgi:general secretion pathway protein G
MTIPMRTMKKKRRNRHPQRGFTLLEVLLVLAILVTLTAIGVTAVQGTIKMVNRRSCVAYIGTLRNAVERYAADVGYPPTPDQGLDALIHRPSDVDEGDWGGPYIHDDANGKDPWGSPYQYARPPSRSGSTTREYEIWSFGPDRRDGTDDDIGSWQNK